MHRSCLEWNRAVSALAALVLLATGANIGSGAPAPLKPAAPKPLPENIVTAWKEAGAEVGWVQLSPDGLPEFVGEKAGKPGDLPAFRFTRWQEGCLANLPAPEAGFGLSLCSTPATDAGLKELAALKSLQHLNLGDTKVTDEGLKELAGLKSLQ